MKALVIFGTRPECIKLAPIIKELERSRIQYSVCVTAQHREMLDQCMEFFGIRANYDLDIMHYNQSLYHVTIEVLLRLRDLLPVERPDLVIVQGDTTTTFAAALAAFYEQIPVAHVEAGLRTGRKYNPFPEEINRRLTDHLSTWCFAPTEQARKNLLHEGIPAEYIWVTGNTVVDALHMIINSQRFRDTRAPLSLPENHRLILVTAHRRENFGEGIQNICYALRQLLKQYEDIEVVYPVHLNPNVYKPVHQILNGLDRVHLLDSVDYLSFLKLIEQSYLILTDSGGIQEEAPTFRKPVLVLREVTERPEGIQLGWAKLVGTNVESIVQETKILLEDRLAYQRMISSGINPYGDGKAALRIVSTLVQVFSKDEALLPR